MIKQEDIFKLAGISSDESVDTEKLIRANKLLMQKLKLELRIIDLINECQKLIKSEGVSSIMSLKRLKAAVLPQLGDTQGKGLLVKTLCDMLTKLSPSKNLLIIDPYIFPHNVDNKNEYLRFFKDIFSESINKVTSFNFITKPKYNQSLFKDCKNLLRSLNSNLSIDCKETNDFHDRLWIVDQNKGLFVGTSLNGVGKNYALADFIRDDDTKEIINILEEKNLI